MESKVLEIKNSLKTKDKDQHYHPPYRVLTSDTTSTGITPMRSSQNKDTIPINDLCGSVHGNSPVIPAQLVTSRKILRGIRRVGRMPTRSTRGNQNKHPSKDEDRVCETFYHRSGKEFQCIYQRGVRFYLDDMGSKEWQQFPKGWYNEGLIVKNTTLKDDGAQKGSGNDQAGTSCQSRSQDRGQGQSSRGGGGGGASIDRVGFIMHPKRGRMPTCMLYKKQSVHMYFDKDTRSWVIMPIAWELHHDMVKSLVDQVEEAIPSWGDRVDILALLRACNYDADECISIYQHLEGDEWMKVARTSKESNAQEDKDNPITELVEKIRNLKLQELRGNIRVFCRVRKDDRGEQYLKFPSDQDLMTVHPQNGKKMFSFDKVFDPSSTQEQVFADTKPIISSCVDGYNVCLLAYGQTGSGKTFTMMGPDSNPGINIRAMTELFEVCQERKETMTYTLTVAIVEIYNEHIQDLLTGDAKTMELRTAGNKVDIPGLTYMTIKNVNDVKRIMETSDKNRHVASTKMNSTSSHSDHVVLLRVEGLDKVTQAMSHGTLTLCDLAGSENIENTEAEGQRFVETAAINKSLSALGEVFSALRSSQSHVPYSNSKLTQILKPSLGGDAKACLFVNVSPDMYNYAETVSTLAFGGNARQVAPVQAQQNISKGKR